jgi:hypothetical protein
MKRTLVLALAVLGLFLFAMQPMASADHMLFGRYYWVRPSSGDLRLRVYLNDVYWRSSFNDAMNEWAGRTEFTFSSYSSSNCDINRTYSYVKICDANYGKTSWGAVADVVVNPSNNQIEAGRVRLNTYYQWSYGSARSAWCQEFGHVLGLDHRGTSGTTSDDADSCMSYHPAEPEHPDSHDIAQLACQTVTSAEPKPNRDCTRSDSGGTSCILGIICFNASSQGSTASRSSHQSIAHAHAHQPTAHEHTLIRLRDGTVLIRFAIPPPLSALGLPHQVAL